MKAGLVVLVSCQCFWLALLLRQLNKALNAYWMGAPTLSPRMDMNSRLRSSFKSKCALFTGKHFLWQCTSEIFHLSAGFIALFKIRFTRLVSISHGV